jgi:hypothetical protein
LDVLWVGEETIEEGAERLLVKYGGYDAPLVMRRWELRVWKREMREEMRVEAEARMGFTHSTSSVYSPKIHKHHPQCQILNRPLLRFSGEVQEP